MLSEPRQNKPEQRTPGVTDNLLAWHVLKFSLAQSVKLNIRGDTRNPVSFYLEDLCKYNRSYFIDSQVNKISFTFDSV